MSKFPVFREDLQNPRVVKERIDIDIGDQLIDELGCPVKVLSKETVEAEFVLRVYIPTGEHSLDVAKSTKLYLYVDDCPSRKYDERTNCTVIMWIQNDSIRKTVIPIRKTQQVECLWRTLKTTPSYVTITVGEYFLMKEKLKRHCSLVSIESTSQLAHNF